MALNLANAQISDALDKTKELVFDFTITANLTPASKVHKVDFPGVVYLRTQGIVADADAIEDLSADFDTAEDTTNGVFGVLIKGSELSNNGIEKVLSVSIDEQTSLGTSYAVTSPANGSAVTSFLTDEGNVAIGITGTGLDLETESPTIRVFVKYREK